MRTESLSVHVDPAAEQVPGWRTLWSPLTGRVRHVLELMRERALTVGEVAEIEARALAAELPDPPAPWALELFDRLSLDATTDREHLGVEQADEMRALCRFLLGLGASLGLGVVPVSDGLDWQVQDLQLRVMLGVARATGRPFFEIDRL